MALGRKLGDGKNGYGAIMVKQGVAKPRNKLSKKRNAFGGNNIPSTHMASTGNVFMFIIKTENKQ